MAACIPRRMVSMTACPSLCLPAWLGCWRGAHATHCISLPRIMLLPLSWVTPLMRCASGAWHLSTVLPTVRLPAPPATGVSGSSVSTHPLPTRVSLCLPPARVAGAGGGRAAAPLARQRLPARCGRRRPCAMGTGCKGVALLARRCASGCGRAGAPPHHSAPSLDPLE
jgi:hypothetical protein